MPQVRHAVPPCPMNALCSLLERDTFLCMVQALSKGECVVKLPHQCQLTYKLADKADDSLLRIIQQVPESFWGLRLAMKVLQQRALGPASPFAPYIRHLPATIPGLPMFFSRALHSCMMQLASQLWSWPCACDATNT